MTLRSSLQLAAVLIALSAAAASCAGDPTGVGPKALRIANAEAKWKSVGVTSYSFTSTIGCYCLDTYTGAMMVTVTQGRVTSIVDVRTGASRPLSYRQPIDSLFALLKTELLERPELLTATFDDKLGFPNRISFGDQALDAGGVITIADVVTIP